MKLLLSLLFLYPLIFSYGQVVNIENKRLMKQEGWSGTNDLNFTFTRNVADIYQFSNRLRVQYSKDRHLFLLLSEIDVVKAADNDFVNRGFEHMRYNYTLDSVKHRFILEAFRQTQFNRVQMIKLRSLYGGGIRFNIFQRDSLMLTLGVTPMLEFEYLTDHTENRHIRLSNYMAFDWQMNETFGMNGIIYYQPDMTWIRDARISVEFATRLKINSHLSYLMTYSMVYDEFPPEGIPRNNWHIKNGLRFTF